MISLTVLSIVATFAFAFMNGGFKFGIDFQPGISLTAQFSEAVPLDSLTSEKLNQSLVGTTYKFSVQSLGDAGKKTFVFRASTSGTQENIQSIMQEDAMKALKAVYGDANVTVVQSDYIGPSLSAELVIQTVGVIVAALVFIFLYVLLRFKIGYAVGAILSLLHDTLFILGFIGAVGMEMSMAVIAAVLTIIGYSLNDTIVVYDRIRENSKLLKGMDTGNLIDTSITQSLSRTILTGGTTILAALSLYVFSTGQVKDFALVMIVGIIVGTYSSIYIASPVLMLFGKGKAVAEDSK